MKIINEIIKHASKDDKPILLWLFNKYHWQSEWNFVASCELIQIGPHSYQVERIWKPTKEGLIIYKYYQKE